MSESCEYCGAPGVLRVEKQEGLDEDVYVCDDCWRLLKDPKTALPLMRGHLTMKLKGKMPPSALSRTVNKYMDLISAWKLRN